MEKDFRAYLRCGILAHGFARARCEDCGHERLIPFSCKGRGICPSCNTRRMAELAAHLTDHVLPYLPTRQWVLSVPKRLRPFLHHNPGIAGAVLQIFLRAIHASLRRVSPGAPANAQLGAVSFLHRFGSWGCQVFCVNGLVVKRVSVPRTRWTDGSGRRSSPIPAGSTAHWLS